MAWGWTRPSRRSPCFWRAPTAARRWSSRNGALRGLVELLRVHRRIERQFHFASVPTTVSD
jgi:hypothetical protein